MSPAYGTKLIKKIWWWVLLGVGGSDEWPSCQAALAGRDSGNNFGRFSVPFLEGWISYIRAAYNYPTRYINFQSRFLDIRLKSVSFLVSQFLCRS